MQAIKNSVLILSDNTHLKVAIATVLESAGLDAIPTQFSELSAEQFHGHAISAILLDTEESESYNFKLHKLFQQFPNSQHFPIMMLIEEKDLDNINNIHSASVIDFILKPIHFESLAYRIHSMIRANQTLHEAQRGKHRLLLAQQKIKQLQTANQEFHEALETLEDKQEQLAEFEKMASLGSLVAGIAHEVNTPVGISITAISYLASKISEIADDFDKGELKRSNFAEFIKVCADSTQIIEINLKRAANLIQNFKQVSVDQTSEAKRSFLLNEYLTQIIASLQPALRQTKLTTTIDCASDLCVNSYPGALFQVMTILVMNSISHGFDTGDSGIISLHGTKQGHYTIIEYRDNGKGIATENLGKIFEPFFTTKRNNGGVGLGLHIAYNLVTQSLKGSIKCQSKPNQGVLFSIRFPSNN